MVQSKRWIKLVGTCVALMALGLIITSPAHGAVAVELSPPMVELTADPGSEQTVEILVTNNSETSQLNLKVSLSPVEEQRDGSYNPVQKQGPWSALPWLQLTSDRMSINPRRSQAAVVNVRIPRGASGTRAAVVVFEVVPDSGATPQSGDAMSGSMTIRNKLLTVLKLTASSRANRKAASIAGLTVSGPGAEPRLAIYGKRALRVSCALQNEGNVLLVATGRLLIRDEKGRRIKDIPLGAGRGAVIPGATVELTSILPQGLPDGDYTVEASIGYGGPGPLRASVPFAVANESVSAEGAQTAVRLTMNPEGIETQLPAGAFRGFSLMLMNLEKEPVTVRGAVKAVVTRAGEFEEQEGDGGLWSAVNWTQLSPDTVLLAPGERKNVRVNVSVPKNAEAGSRYAALILQATRTEAAQEGAVTTLLVPVIINVGRDLVRNFTVENPTLLIPDDGNGAVIGARLVNRGNTHLEATGRIVLQRKAGPPKASDGAEIVVGNTFTDVAVLPIPDSGLVLPGASAPVVVRYDRALTPGEYQVVMVVEYGEDSPLSLTMPFKLGASEADPKTASK